MKTRIISAIILLAIAIPILLIGKLPFAIFITVVSCLALHEMHNVSSKKRNIPFPLIIISYILVIFLTISNYNLKNNIIFNLDYRIVSIIFMAYLIPIIFIKNKDKYTIEDAMFLIGSTILIGVSFNLLITIRAFNLNYIIYMFLITIPTDTFAYLTGMSIGKHKLLEHISPKKTIEGSIGGSIMGAIISSLFFIKVIGGLNIFVVIIMSLILTIIAQIGDLVFSGIKRYYKVKDFSNLIPGHGGVLDRLDSFIFVELVFIIFLTIL